jgi:2-polyprenyl-3-methyl-5-hydroxy-6-metoxy-1,4-benzoquinol methylase
MSFTDEEKWDRIYQTKDHTNKQAAQILIENQHLLPESGKALDLACGLGANALLLAKHDLETHAWDISKEAITKLDQKAEKLNINLITEVRDVINNPPAQNAFDVIVVIHFLERQIIKCLIKALRKNGLIFYQTFTKDKVSDTGPKNLDYLLDKNELLTLFKDFNILVYREEGSVGDKNKGLRNEAMLIAQNA